MVSDELKAAERLVNTTPQTPEILEQARTLAMVSIARSLEELVVVAREEIG